LLGLDDLDADEHAGELMAGRILPQNDWNLSTIPGVRRLDLSSVGLEAGPDSRGSDRALQAELGVGVTDLFRQRDAARREQASERTDAGLTALLAEPSAVWPATDEDLARLAVAPRKAADDSDQRLDDVLSSVGDWLDPLDEVLGFVKQSR
jgi:hypothetical protein